MTPEFKMDYNKKKGIYEAILIKQASLIMNIPLPMLKEDR
jgi:hypothetical protein